MRRILPFLLLLSLLAATSAQPAEPGESKQTEKSAAAITLPNRTLTAISGDQIALGHLADKGPFLLDFWATWCLPCRHAFPQYAALEERYREQGFRVITVSQDAPGNEQKIEALLRLIGVEFPVLQDPDATLAGEMGVQHLPTSFLVDGEGQVVWTHVGFLPGDDRLLDAELRKLLGLDAD